MSGFSEERENEILDAQFVTGFLALVTVAVTPGDTGATITEPTYTPYARVEMTEAEWEAAVGGQKVSNATKTFPEPAEGEDTAVGWALCTTEAVGTGDVIFSGRTPPTLLSEGVPPQFLAGALIARLTGG